MPRPHHDSLREAWRPIARHALRAIAAAAGLGLLRLSWTPPSLAEDGPSIRIVPLGGTTTVRREAPRSGGGGGVEGGSDGGVDGGSDGGRGGGAGSLSNGSFDDGLASWDAEEHGGASEPGGVSADGGQASLREGDSFLVSLSQRFVLEPGTAALSFSLVLDPGLDTSAAAIPDAFEVSLLDDALGSVLETWSPEATSFLNLGEDGGARAGPGIDWDGSRATVDVSAVAPGTAVTIHFDLIGADSDTGGGVRVDAVALAAAESEGFIRGNADGDHLLNITDPIVILNYLFLGTSTVECLDSADTDNDGRLNITDPIYLLGYLFLGSSAPPAPFPGCGPDEGPDDDLGCAPCSCPGSSEGGNCP